MNKAEVDKEEEEGPCNRIHRTEHGTEACRATAWHICLCDQKDIFHLAEIMDRRILIVDLPAMVLNWKEDVEKFCGPIDKDSSKQPSPDANDLTFLIAPEEFSKGADKVERHADELKGVLPEAESIINGDDPMDVDLDYKWDDERKAHVLASSPGGQYYRALPQMDSSRFIIITTAQSYPGHVAKHLRSRSHTYCTGGKLKKSNLSSVFPVVCPALVSVDEAHLVRQASAGYFALYRGIESRCEYTLESIWPTGTPFGKRPSDILAMTSAMQLNNEWTDNPLGRLSNTALRKLDEEIAVLEDEVERGTLRQRE